MTSDSRQVYRLEPLDTSGIFLGLGVVQCGLLGTGITLAVLAITAGLPVLVAAVPVGGAVFVSFGRLGRHAVWEWLPLLANWVWAQVGNRREWHATLPLVSSANEPVTMPPCLDGIDIIGIDWRTSGELGAIRDHHRHTLTAVVPVTGPQFVVASDGEQEHLLSSWGDVLGQFAVDRGSVVNVTWSDLAKPSGMGDHIAWVADDHHGTSNPDAAAAYQELLRAGRATATAHETFVTITVARERVSGRRGAAQGDDEPLRRALSGATEALLRGLRSAGLSASEPLDPPGLQRLIRSRIDPVSTQGRPTTGRLAERLGLVSNPSVGPMALTAEWSHLRVDGSFHRTWWVGTWPRSGMPPSWLEPFLTGGGVTRTMTVVFAPVSNHQSRRRIERDLVKLESDAATKEENGRRIDARHQRSTQALLEREQELVAGFPEMAYAGLVTVSAQDLDTLDEHSEVIEQLARESGMDLRRLDARQDVGWAATLPIGLAPTTLMAT